MRQWYNAANIPNRFTVGAGPYGLAFDGAHIWVSNYGSPSYPHGTGVTELNASDGSMIGTFTAGGDLSNPVALAFDGKHIWVGNVSGNSVTELNASDGSKVGTFTAGGDIQAPGLDGLVFDGAHIWVSNTNGNSVTELNASDGSKVGTFTVGTNPVGLVFDGAHIWVTNSNSNSVTELNVSDGSQVGYFTDGIYTPNVLAFDGAHIWVGSAFGASVTELNASDGSVVGTFTAGGDISYPSALASTERTSGWRAPVATGWTSSDESAPLGDRPGTAAGGHRQGGRGSASAPGLPSGKPDKFQNYCGLPPSLDVSSD
jgi:outer membrane protein assembly factor BamB